MFARIKKLLRDRRGNVLMIAGLTAPVVFGAAGLAVDTIQWTMWKRELQRAADSAAFAGVYAKAENNAGMTAEQAVAADLIKHQTTGIALLGGYPQISYPTGTNFTDAVSVSLAIQKTLGFSSMFMSQAPIIVTSATAALVDDGTYCVVALAPSGSGLSIGGSADIDMGCGAISNSNNATASVSTNGNSYSFEADPVAAVGGMPSSINGATELQPFHIAMQDPYASLPTTIPAGVTCTNWNHASKTNADGSKKPGCYNSMQLSNSVATLSPGVYYLNNTSIDLQGHEGLRGTGVTIILTGTNPGTLTMNGSSILDLTAPTSGTYANMLIIQAPGATTGNNNLINGDNGTILDGAIYFPSGDLEITGSSTGSTQCAMIVAYTVTFSGSSEIQNDTSGCEANTTVQGKKVRLIA